MSKATKVNIVAISAIVLGIGLSPIIYPLYLAALIIQYVVLSVVGGILYPNEGA